MAITVTTPLASDVAAYVPVTLAGTTSRTNYKADGTANSSSITAISNAGGKAQLIVSLLTANLWEVDDIILISGATGDFAVYNGRHKVTAVGTITVPARTITLDTDYISAASGTRGTASKYNTALKVRADVYSGATLLGSVYATPVIGNWEMDLRKVMQAGFSSIFSLVNGALTTTGAAYEYTVDLFEQWQDIDYSTQQEEDVSEQQTGIAHAVTSVASIATNDMLNGFFRAYGSLVIHILTDETDDLDFIFTSAAATVSSETTVTTTPVNKHAGAVYRIPALSRYITVEVKNSVTEASVKDTLTIPVLANSCGKRLYYRNKQGGFTSIEFKSVERFNEVTKVDRYVVKSYDVYDLVSNFEARENAAYLGDIAHASEVYDELGNEVEVISPARFQTFGENVQLTITVRNEQDYIG